MRRSLSRWYLYVEAVLLLDHDDHVAQRRITCRIVNAPIVGYSGAVRQLRPQAMQLLVDKGLDPRKSLVGAAAHPGRSARTVSAL